MSKKVFIDPDNGQKMIRCPGCRTAHVIDNRWTYNGDDTNPTFSPSLKVTWSWKDRDDKCCHSFIKNGVWEFLNDCTHELAGQHVPVPDW